MSNANEMYSKYTYLPAHYPQFLWVCDFQTLKLVRVMIVHMVVIEEASGLNIVVQNESQRAHVKSYWTLLMLRTFQSDNDKHQAVFFTYPKL